MPVARLQGITDQRVYAGFVGTADGLDRARTTALIAPIRDPFPIERPQLEAGRLPDPRAADEAIVNAAAANRDLHVGQVLHFRFVNPLTSATTEADIEIVGTGTFPAEIVADQTQALGLFVFTRAFYDSHRDFAVYAVSNVDLAPGFDARRDLAPAAGRLGYQLQSARTQEQTTVSDALRPLVIVLIAIGVLAFGAAVVASGQVVVRTRDRWQADNDRLRTLGMARSQILLVELATAGVVAGFGARDRARHDALRVTARAHRPAPRSRPGSRVRRRRHRGRGGCRHRRRDAAPARDRVLVGAVAGAPPVAPTIAVAHGAPREPGDGRRDHARPAHR